MLCLFRRIHPYNQLNFHNFSNPTLFLDFWIFESMISCFGWFELFWLFLVVCFGDCWSYGCCYALFRSVDQEVATAHVAVASNLFFWPFPRPKDQHNKEWQIIRRKMKYSSMPQLKSQMNGGEESSSKEKKKKEISDGLPKGHQLLTLLSLPNLPFLRMS